MTIPLSALLLLAFALSAPAAQIETDKTARMAEIEDDYDLTITGIIRVGGLDYWVFMESEPSALYGRYPVVVLQNASDHDIETAIIAAENCASFYDVEVKHASERKNP